MNKAQIIEAIKELSVLELNELVKACEEEFGVSAAAGVVVAASGRRCCGRGRADRIHSSSGGSWRGKDQGYQGCKRDHRLGT